MNAEALLSRLRGVRRNGNGWIALCPAHADSNPSLSIRERDGKILLHCFAGCTVEAICASLEIKMGDLFSELRGMHKPQPGMVRDVQKHIAGLRSRLTPRDRERRVAVVYCERRNLDAGIARALALAIEGELVQVVFE